MVRVLCEIPTQHHDGFLESQSTNDNGNHHSLLKNEVCYGGVLNVGFMVSCNFGHRRVKVANLCLLQSCN